MKINAIGCAYNGVTRNKIHRSNQQKTNNINFNGYCGKIGGIIAGGAAAVGLAIFAAPVLICAGPVLAAAGMYAGDKAEDEINKAMDDKPEND